VRIVIALQAREARVLKDLTPKDGVWVRQIFVSATVIQYENKRINQEMLKNWFAKRFFLQDQAAAICARSFVQSLKFGGLIAADEILRGMEPLDNRPGQKDQDSANHSKLDTNTGLDPGEQRFVLPLDRSGARKFIAISPATVTSQELKRIQDWLSFQLIVEDPQAEI
jgi:hypothetical protein